MKKLRAPKWASRALLLALPVALAASALGRPRSQDPAEALELTARAREEISAMYEIWGKARVEVDVAVIEKTLAPDFYVLLDGRRISREQFVTDITRKREGSELTRFDAEILTVQRLGEEWTVVITEKLEIEYTAADGSTSTLRSLWITRDGWREEEGEWLVTYSDAIGYEYWPSGSEVPFEDW